MSSHRTLSILTAAYVVSAFCVLVIVSRVFGAWEASCLSLLLFVPLPLYLVVRLRRRQRRRREFVYVYITLALTSVGSIAVVYVWHDKGLDSRHARVLKRAKFERVVHADPAFSGVAVQSGENYFSIEGTVATNLDFARLKSAAEEYGIHWSHRFHVRVEANGEGKPEGSNNRPSHGGS